MDIKREYIDVIAIWDEMINFRNDSFGMAVMVISSEIVIFIVCDAYSVCLHASTPLATSGEVTRK